MTGGDIFDLVFQAAALGLFSGAALGAVAALIKRAIQ